MTAFVPVVVAAAAGWGLAGLFDDGEGFAARLADAVLLAVVSTGVWMVVLDFAGIPWGPLSVAVGWLPGLVLLVRSVRPAVAGIGAGLRPSPWALAAAGMVAARGVLVGAVPAFGWDFRYIWGLKARVFVLAGGHDLAWLAMPGHLFSHPGYPPLWPDLVAAGMIGGAPAGQSAAAWGVLLVLGLGAACWRLARPAGTATAALAAGVGAWFPGLLAPAVTSSGSAEPLAAFLFAAALGGVAGREEGKRLWMTALALGGLGVVKREGMILAAIALVPFVRRVPGRWRAALAVIVAVPAVLWQITVSLAGIPRIATLLEPDWLLERLVQLPRAVAAGGTAVLALEALALVLVLAVPSEKGTHSLRFLTAVWLTAVFGAYLVSPFDLPWQVATSLERVLAIPVPALLAAALGGFPAEVAGGNAPA